MFVFLRHLYSHYRPFLQDNEFRIDDAKQYCIHKSMPFFTKENNFKKKCKWKKSCEFNSKRIFFLIFHFLSNHIANSFPFYVVVNKKNVDSMSKNSPKKIIERMDMNHINNKSNIFNHLTRILFFSFSKNQ